MKAIGKTHREEACALVFPGISRMVLTTEIDAVEQRAHNWLKEQGASVEIIAAHEAFAH
jgi:hypothetical protein